MTSADQARFRADPAWWEAHRKGTQKKKENPAWREAQRLANQKMTSTPEWRAANRKANQKLAADPAWRAANRKAMQIVASTPEWRAAKFQATNSHYEPRLVKPIPAEALAELIAYLQATKGAGLPLVRALLRFSDAPKWQIKNAMVEAGLCSPSNELQGHTALHYLRPQLPIAPAKDQSPEAFVARLRELCAIGAKRSYAAFIAGLEFPSITGGEANRIAIAAGYEHRNLGTEINIARAIARLVAEYEAERVLATAAE